jgi:hypothetical protein
MIGATRRGVLAAALGGAIAAGCATGAGQVTGAYMRAGSFNVTFARPWSDITFMLPNRPPNVRMLSVDGPLLNRLYLGDLLEGESLFRPRDRDTPRPTYRGDMSDTEMVEFVIDCVAVEYQGPEASALRPQTLAGQPGVRFDFSTRTAEGLDMSGTALVARANNRMNLMIFLAPSEHYYGAMLAEVEALMASATLAG